MNQRSKNNAIALTAIAASLLYIPSSAWAGCVDNATNASADAGSTCTLSLSNYGGATFSANGTQVVLVSDAGTTLSSTNTTVQSSESEVGGFVIHSGAKFISTGQLNINLNGTNRDGLGINDVGTQVNINNVSVITTDNGNASAISAGAGAKLIILGDTQVTVTETRAGLSPTGIVSFGGDLSEMDKGEINLNSATVNINGANAQGIVSSELGVLNATGKVIVNTSGARSVGVLGINGSNLTLAGGGSITATGNQSVALGVMSSATILQDDGPDVVPAANQVTLNNYVLSSAQGNVIEAKGGTSTINLNQNQAAASTGQKLLFVSNASDLPADYGITPNAALLTLNANASNLTGDVAVATDGSTAHLNFTNGSVYTGMMSNVTYVTTDASSLWNMTASSTLAKDLNNAGTVNFQNLGNTLTVNGNYNGTAGSVISLETQLGDDSSPTDKLHVVGNTTGTTRLDVRNAGGTGALTVNGINIVQVDGTSDANSFTMAGPVQAGSYEYTLKQGSALDANDWYLTSKYTTNSPTTCLALGCTNPPVIDIYRPSVAAYTVAQTANADVAFTQISSLHQRMGEQRNTPTDKPQTWGRIIAAGQSNNGHERFEYDQTTTGFQFGRDLLSQTAATGTQQRVGVTVNYTHSNVDARDRVRPLVGLSQNTGSIGSNTIGLGGYYTQIAKNGLYFDAVGQINHLTNKYNDSYGGKSTQHGWQVGLSGEVGQSVANLKGWSVEPQAQLSYLYTKYSDFTDAYSNIHNKNTHNLRGRLGLRLTKDSVIDGKAAQYYGIVNVAHDFIKPKAINLSDTVGTGSNSVRESFDRTYGEVGAGIQGSVSQSTDIYADARYQRSFKGDKEGAQFNVGVKMKF
jgi:autotransporter family porin